MLPGEIAARISGSRTSIGNWLKRGLRSIDQIDQPNQHQAADRADGGQQPNQRTKRNNEVGHKEILKGRKNSVLTPGLFSRLLLFARFYTMRFIEILSWSTHVAGAIHRVVFLAGEFFEHDGGQACFKHRLQGFLEIRVPAAGAHLAVPYGPVPGSL